MDFFKVIFLSVAVGLGIMLAFLWYPIFGLVLPFSAISYLFLEPKDLDHVETPKSEINWEPRAA